MLSDMEAGWRAGREDVRRAVSFGFDGACVDVDLDADVDADVYVDVESVIVVSIQGVGWEADDGLEREGRNGSWVRRE